MRPWQYALLYTILVGVLLYGFYLLATINIILRMH